MTRLRHALVLVSVVLFALALGVAVGGGLLHGQVRAVLQSQVSDDDAAQAARTAALARDNRALSRALRYDGRFAQALSTDLLAGELSDRSVIVLALPGVPSSVAEGVADDVATAGGTVTTTLRVGRDLVDPTARPLVDELSKRLLADLDDRELPDDASTYTRVGVVAARALLTRADAGYAMDDAARSVFNTFTTAGLLRGEEPQQRASTAVVLLPEANRRGGPSAGRNTVLTEMVAAMDEAGDGVVVAGPPSTAEQGRLLRALRARPLTADTVSTVDTSGLRSGRIVTVLALAEQADGSTGHYGLSSSADAVLPGADGTG